MQGVKKKFIPPPEAPVFEPSWEDFCDPLAYIDKIRPIGEKYGVCKIRPPPSWQPPFAVDVDTFRFTPRIQKLNELEALSRVKLNFIHLLTKFWTLQIVKRNGGFFDVCRQDQGWIKVAQLMGYTPGRGCELILSQQYEKILHPYDLFLSGESLNAKKFKEMRQYDFKSEPKLTNGKLKKMRRMVSTLPCYRKEEAVPAKIKTEANESASTNAPTKIVIKQQKNEQDQMLMKNDPLYVSKADQYFCEVCDGGDDEPLMLLCDGCDHAYHTYCLMPPLEKVPPGDWMCPRCIAKECLGPMEAYGFEQSPTEYSLESFGIMADGFKRNHFNMPAHLVPYSACEEEFWRLVECLEEDVSVEYGADIHSGEQGSGFPTEKTRDRFSGDEEYIKSGWNLNNLPILDMSVLKHVSVDISGMMVPWVYIGMCFSSFSWHIEDHWSYSVNYMHWGEPKTWYGVPGSHAELLEECMMKEVPELFKDAPDLLHQLTTILNPNILMDYGVPVFRTDQCPGEFVITFPRSYHAGFNQGYNCAEAVNFCPPDWVHMGRECIEDYRKFKRQCVFSHNQLLCEMAEKSKTLNLKMAAVVHDDLIIVVDNEKKLRHKMALAGIILTERFHYDLVENDDDKQCDVCKTTCYLSTLHCPLDPERLICLEHDPIADMKCPCPPSSHIIRYKFTNDELMQLVENLKVRSMSLDNWKAKVREVLFSTNQKKPDISYLKELLAEVTSENLPQDDLVSKLREKMTMCESSVEMARELMNKKLSNRQQQQRLLAASLLDQQQQQQQQLHSPPHHHLPPPLQQQQQQQQQFVCRLNLFELKAFCDRAKDLPCTFKEAGLIQDLLDNVLVLQREVVGMLSSDSMPIPSRLQEIMDWALSLDLLAQAKWLNEYNNLFSSNSKLTLPTLKKLNDTIITGASGVFHPLYQSSINKVRSLVVVAESVERKADQCLRDRPTIQTLELIINEAEPLASVDLHQLVKVKELMKEAKRWQDLALTQTPWFKELGVKVDLNENIPGQGRRGPAVQFSNDGTFVCPFTCITLDSLQSVVKKTFTKLVSARNDIRNKLYECSKAINALSNSSGSSSSSGGSGVGGSVSSGNCSCGRHLTEHVRCCVLCTIIYYAATTTTLTPLDSSNTSNQSSSLPSSSSSSMFASFTTNKMSFMSPPSFPATNKLFSTFPMGNSGLFSTNNIQGGLFQTSQSSPSNIFGTANSILAPIMPINKNFTPSLNAFSPTNNSAFSATNSNPGLFQWSNQGPSKAFSPGFGSGDVNNSNRTGIQPTMKLFSPTLSLPTATNNNSNNNTFQTPNNNPNNTFSPNNAKINLCDLCKDSVDRPTYDELKALVAGWYNMSGVCMPEGRALLYLVDLVNEWQQKARKVLSSRELVVAVGLLDMPSTDLKDGSWISTNWISDQMTRITADPIFRPRLISLDVSMATQTTLTELLVEMSALNVETEEVIQLRLLLYSCYEKIVLTESIRKEEEQRRQAKMEEERKKKQEEADRLKKLAEEKKKREDDELKKRKLEEDEFKRRVDEENNKRRKLQLVDSMKRQQRQQLAGDYNDNDGDGVADDDDDDGGGGEDDVASDRQQQNRNKLNNQVSPTNGTTQSRETSKLKPSKKHIYTDDEDDDDDDVKINSRSDDDYGNGVDGSDEKKTIDTSSDNVDRSSSDYLKPNQAQPSRPMKNKKRKKKNKRKNNKSKNNDGDDDDDVSRRKMKKFGNNNNKKLAKMIKSNDNVLKKKEASGGGKKKLRQRESQATKSPTSSSTSSSFLPSPSRLASPKPSSSAAAAAASLSTNKKDAKRKFKKKKRRKRKDDDDDDDDEHDDDDDDDDDNFEGFIIKGSEAAVAATKKRQNNHKNNNKSDKNSSTVDSNNGSNSTNNNWEYCSFTGCLKPTGDKVNWVQCDLCEQWYHLECVGLDELPGEEEEFECQSCLLSANQSTCRSSAKNNDDDNNTNNNNNKIDKDSYKSSDRTMKVLSNSKKSKGNNNNNNKTEKHKKKKSKKKRSDDDDDDDDVGDDDDVDERNDDSLVRNKRTNDNKLVKKDNMEKDRNNKNNNNNNQKNNNSNNKEKNKLNSFGFALTGASNVLAGNKHRNSNNKNINNNNNTSSTTDNNSNNNNNNNSIDRDCRKKIHKNKSKSKKDDDDPSSSSSSFLAPLPKKSWLNSSPPKKYDDDDDEDDDEEDGRGAINRAASNSSNRHKRKKSPRAGDKCSTDKSNRKSLSGLLEFETKVCKRDRTEKLFSVLPVRCSNRGALCWAACGRSH
ncbi:hypothetical protein HELRODRAFT_194466 [Helobdella robusta]|uniref:[histone H3]-trimethyl-L-lysine(4) demethylase n=1 Tax=Helobdella robusta TaxID=6412 RepID=T1FW30_HELRO|nr:hypothetical protein HELRODRAFT_194466 [Helobdella robusta]ESN91986.1 hypothetical protein HELRODRAFT_194466 [Helobdella robusta]